MDVDIATKNARLQKIDFCIKYIRFIISELAQPSAKNGCILLTSYFRENFAHWGKIHNFIFTFGKTRGLCIGREKKKLWT